MRIERRNKTSLGRKRRRDFDRSLLRLRDLGMPRWAVEYYARVARVTGLPPHMVMCHVAVVFAGRQLQAPKPQEQAGKGAGDGVSGPEGDPSYQTASTKLAFLREARANSERVDPRPRRGSGASAKGA